MQCPTGDDSSRHYVNGVLERSVAFRTARLLTEAGVKVIRIKMPADHPLTESKQSPVLTESDSLDLIIDLNIAEDAELGDFKQEGVEPPQNSNYSASDTE